MSNIDIMNWVKELKIKRFDCVFNKDSHQWASYCRINLDGDNGSRTHWACYVDSFYFVPFGLPPPENILFIKRYNTLQYQEKISVLCGYFCLFFIKNSKMVIQFTFFFLYTILDPIYPSKNETILEDYFINYWNV